MASALVLPSSVGEWLLELGLFDHTELDAPPLDSYVLGRQATQEFVNGTRVARLLQELGVGDAQLDTLKETSTPVAKLYNWNLLLPKLRQQGLDVDQDMKVLIVAGDLEIVVDLLEQLQRATVRRAPASSVDALSGGGSAAADAVPPPKGGAASSTSVAQLLAFCCQQELGVSWGQALALVRNHRQLARQQMGGAHGARGGFVPIVRWYKLVFSHCRLLCTLCARLPEESELALSAVGGGLSSADDEVALWCSRLLCRIAAELAAKGDALALWRWFSKQSGGGASALFDAWRNHPDLHAQGALMPIALHYVGENLLDFVVSVLPRHLSSASTSLSFLLELLPVLASAEGTREFVLGSGTLKHLLSLGLQAATKPQAPPTTRTLALELLASLWTLFTRELQTLPIEGAVAGSGAPSELTAFQDVLTLGEGARGAEGEGGEGLGAAAVPRDAGSLILRELKRGCRDSSLELQLGAHMTLFRLLDEFAAKGHPGAPYLFNVLAFSLIENHHEPTLRPFLARNMQHTLQRQPHIPVGVLLKPLVKQATLYGYNNTDFDFFLALAKHQRLGLRHALLMMQFLGKVCLNDALHGRVATIPFLVLVERFHESDVLHDFIEIFCEQALATLLPATSGVEGKRAGEASAIRSTLVIELVAKLLHLPHNRLLARVAPTVTSAAQQYMALRGVEHPGLTALLHFAARARPELAPPSLELPPPELSDLAPPADEGFKVRPAEQRGRSTRGGGEVVENLVEGASAERLPLIGKRGTAVAGGLVGGSKDSARKEGGYAADAKGAGGRRGRVGTRRIPRARARPAPARASTRGAAARRLPTSHRRRRPRARRSRARRSRAQW